MSEEHIVIKERHSLTFKCWDIARASHFYAVCSCGWRGPEHHSGWISEDEYREARDSCIDDFAAHRAATQPLSICSGDSE